MRFVLLRLLRLLVVLLVVTFLVTWLITLVPGGPVDAIAPFASEEQKAAIADDLGLDDPAPVAWWHWLTGFVHGDMGSIYSGPTSSQPVSDQVESALPKTITLIVMAQVIALAVAIPLGVAGAARAGSLFDKSVNVAAFALLAVPSFVVALLLAYLLGVKADLFPALYDPRLEGVTGTFKNYFLPALSLALAQIAVYARLLRSDMIATLQEDFIAMARAKGMPRSHILWRHALRPSSLTLLTAAALTMGTLIGGALVVENIFNIPGMGRALAQNIVTQQYQAIQSEVALVAVIFVLINAVVDLLYAVLDPRTRHVGV